MRRWIAVVAALALSGSMALAQENMLRNGGLEDGVVDPWISYGQATLSVTSDNVYEGSFALQVEVPAAGANFWDSGVQYQEGVVFEAGTTYTWAFFAKADHTVNINIKPELAQDPWTGYGEHQVELTTDWQEFYATWTPDTLVQPASLTLHVAFDAATLWIDAARWYVGEYVPYESVTAVDPKGKLATTWAQLKR
ncbi:MAG: hypothetical protein KatS3mg115_1122 [Candidatus Poribacteria bacterium]|nr:MAG: hypothetical protein KatS3mg115_1122 [Candidatus Poribacteria bacterium]